VSFELTEDPEGLDVMVPDRHETNSRCARARSIQNPGRGSAARRRSARGSRSSMRGGEITMIRHAYPVESAQAKVAAAGLPDVVRSGCVGR
jgi:hypothetical protein